MKNIKYLIIITLTIWLVSCAPATPTPSYPPFIIFAPPTDTPSPTAIPIPDNWTTESTNGPAIIDVSIYEGSTKAECQSVKVNEGELFAHPGRMVYVTKFSSQAELDSAWSTHVPVVAAKPDICLTFENQWTFDEWVQQNHPGY